MENNYFTYIIKKSQMFYIEYKSLISVDMSCGSQPLSLIFNVHALFLSVYNVGSHGVTKDICYR